MYVICHINTAYTRYVQCHVHSKKTPLLQRFKSDGLKKVATIATSSLDVCTCSVGACMAHMVVDAMYAKMGELMLVSAMLSM